MEEIMIKHIAIRDSEDSYFQDLTNNTIVLCSNRGFDEVVSILHSPDTIFFNENDEEFTPNLEYTEKDFKRIIKNGKQTITFFVFQIDCSVSYYDSILRSFKNHIKKHEDIWFIPASRLETESETTNYEIIAFTEYENHENFSKESIRRGIYSGRFGFLYPESVFQESLKVHAIR